MGGPLQPLVRRGSRCQRLPFGISLILINWPPDEFQRASLAGTKLTEVLLGFPQGRLVCATLIIRVIKLDTIVFPETDRTNIICSRRLLLQRFIPAARASEFLRLTHKRQAPNDGLQLRRAISIQAKGKKIT